ncbi:MAG: TIGR04076 family protein [Chloroflexota bacterium]|nr:MAG: TIGR04076 family protein [Chloroflexota bacterium]
MSDLIVDVVSVAGHCPVFAVGDRFEVADGFRLRADRDLCMHALMALAPYYVALSRGVEPADLGLAGPDGAAYVQCLDPQHVTGGGTVTFRIRRAPPAVPA